jgi:flagellar biosynthesis/type III secretory pathway chaperone
MKRLLDLLQQELSLLRQLHLAAQTEYLAIENEDSAELARVVAEKEMLVARIDLLEKEITEFRQEYPALMKDISTEQKKRLSQIKNEGLDLIDAINHVDSENKDLLEKMKDSAIARTHQIHQSRQLLHAYFSHSHTKVSFSELAE